MAGAFQRAPEAFQLVPLAFQLDEAVAEAFQCGGFQTDAFQVAADCVITTPPREDVVPSGGGISYTFRPVRRRVEEDEALLLHLLH